MNARQRIVKAPRAIPPLNTDEEAEAFLEKDLSDLDFTVFKKANFKFVKKGK